MSIYRAEQYWDAHSFLLAEREENEFDLPLLESFLQHRRERLLQVGIRPVVPRRGIVSWSHGLVTSLRFPR